MVKFLPAGDSMNPKDNNPNEPVDPLIDNSQVEKSIPDPESDDSSPLAVSVENAIEQAALDSVDTAERNPENAVAVQEPVANETAVVDAQVVGSGGQRQAPTGLAMTLELLKVFAIPAFILAAFVAGIALLGVAQRTGWITSDSGERNSSSVGSTSQESNASYICPMMCVPPTTKPGRCPVCAMELVPASASSSSGPSSKIQIDPRSRRVAGIETVVAKSQSLSREVRGVGEISYDESKLKTLSAYIDGRIEELYADYTGIEVKKGDSLAMLYSPELYGAQVEYARTLEFTEKAAGTNSRIAGSNKRLLDSSRERLVELGMTETQIKKLESDKVANRRLALHAPISGTVIEKMAVTGQYIKAGTPIYRLADLSTVWLVLELFPEDAKSIRIGQPVTAMTQSMGDVACEGIVEFVEPTVDPKMRTVGIRVAINNEHGHLKPGEFAKATLTIPLLSKDGKAQETIVVPRDSLLSIGQTSLAYVEEKPGEFQLRHVKTGPTVGGQVAIFEGIAAGENVVSRSTFLLDAQMQLQGNPSLIDPDKAVMPDPNEVELTEAQLEEIRIAMEPLSEADRAQAEAQVICPVTEVRLGTLGMGTPIKLEIEGRTVFICCEGCRDMWVEKPAKYFKILDDYLSGKSSSKEIVPTTATTPSAKDADLPKMELPQMELPKMDLPREGE
jgi:Cu(I)/Ag(I) efflux system membrane fusion protein